MRSSQRGISLVEALLALLMLSIGLLSMAKIHFDMRVNADLARQRAEAIRIAQSEMEQLRTGDSPAPAPRRAVAGGIAAAYTLSRQVDPIVGGLAASVTVRVEWKDRTGAVQYATLSSIIARSDPALEAAHSATPALAARVSGTTN